MRKPCPVHSPSCSLLVSYVWSSLRDLSHAFDIMALKQTLFPSMYIHWKPGLSVQTKQELKEQECSPAAVKFSPHSDGRAQAKGHGQLRGPSGIRWRLTWVGEEVFHGQGGKEKWMVTRYARHCPIRTKNGGGGMTGSWKGWEGIHKAVLSKG